MTREFCDRCKREVYLNDRYQQDRPHRIDFLGRWLHPVFEMLCVNCYQSLGAVIQQWSKVGH